MCVAIPRIISQLLEGKNIYVTTSHFHGGVTIVAVKIFISTSLESQSSGNVFMFPWHGWYHRR